MGLAKYEKINVKQVDRSTGYYEAVSIDTGIARVKEFVKASNLFT